MQGEIQEIEAEIARFCAKREWDQFHSNKDLAAAIAIEVAELQEAFLWDRVATIEKIKEELADVFIYAFRMAERNGLDVMKIVREKLAVNAAKYPVEKCRGSASKYTNLNEGVYDGR
ncbi:MAG: nucleotide pyrophosphohydrolase [Kiritimatiellae bacterium]|nr:nucleotide pyrophosphohydrolase [Kiritimatiellia bacterium]